MEHLIGTILLKNINICEYHDLLEIINKIDNNVMVQFKIPISKVAYLIKEYLRYHSDHLRNIDDYDCVFLEIIDTYGDGNYYLRLNSSEDDEDSSDIEFIKEELKRQFGANFNNDVSVEKVLKILLMGSEYDIISNDSTLVINMFYQTFNKNWIKNIINNINY